VLVEWGSERDIVRGTTPGHQSPRMLVSSACEVHKGERFYRFYMYAPGACEAHTHAIPPLLKHE
jgi:hypothetical protein